MAVLCGEGVGRVISIKNKTTAASHLCVRRQQGENCQ